MREILSRHPGRKAAGTGRLLRRRLVELETVSRFSAANVAATRLAMAG